MNEEHDVFEGCIQRIVLSKSFHRKHHQRLPWCGCMIAFSYIEFQVCIDVVSDGAVP